MGNTVTTLLKAVSELNVSELRELLSLLKRADFHEAMKDIVENAIRLRRSERVHRSRRSKLQELPEQPEEDTRLHYQSLPLIHSDELAYDQLKEYFCEILGDRTRFPSTKDVIKEIGNQLNIHLSYKDFRKRGRRDLIERSWSGLKRFPRQEQISRLRSFFSHNVRGDSEASGYKELFRILTRNE